MSKNTTQYVIIELLHQDIKNQQKNTYKTQNTGKLEPEDCVLGLPILG